MEEQELELAPDKTEVVILAGRRKLTKMEVTVGLVGKSGKPIGN